MANEHVTMETWQADTFATWAILGEIVAALDLEGKMDWQRVVRDAADMSPDGMSEFIKATVKGVREQARKAKSSGGR